MAGVLNVTFIDGTAAQYRLGARAVLEAEDELGADIVNKPMRATFVAAWKTSKSTLPFDDWLDTIETFKEEEGTAPAGPTVPAPSPDESPT